MSGRELYQESTTLSQTTLSHSSPLLIHFPQLDETPRSYGGLWRFQIDDRLQIPAQSLFGKLPSNHHVRLVYGPHGLINLSLKMQAAHVFLRVRKILEKLFTMRYFLFVIELFCCHYRLAVKWQAYEHGDPLLGIQTR